MDGIPLPSEGSRSERFGAGGRGIFPFLLRSSPDAPGMLSAKVAPRTFLGVLRLADRGRQELYEVAGDHAHLPELRGRQVAG